MTEEQLYFANANEDTSKEEILKMRKENTSKVIGKVTGEFQAWNTGIVNIEVNELLTDEGNKYYNFDFNFRDKTDGSVFTSVSIAGLYKELAFKNLSEFGKEITIMADKLEKKIMKK